MSYIKPSSFAYKIAPSDGSDRTKQVADVILTGTADQTIINAALATYKNVEIGDGNVNTTGAINIIGPNGTDGPTFKLKTGGKFSTIINVATNINGLVLTGDPSVWIDGLDLRILGSGNGIVSTAEATTPTYRGFWMSHFKDIYVRGDFSTHTGFALTLEGPFRSVFENIEALGIANGIQLSATNPAFNPGNCSFNRLFFDIYRANGKGFYFYTPDAGGQFNITRFQQCEAVDSSGTSTTSIGMHFRGSSNSYFSTKNILIDSTNLEQFNTAIKFEHSISNRVILNYVEVANNGTYVDVSSDSQNNSVEILSSYVAPSRTVKFINDLNTSVTMPTIIKGAEAYTDTSSVVNVTMSPTTQYTPYGNGFSGVGTIAPQLLSNNELAIKDRITTTNATQTTLHTFTLPSGSTCLIQAVVTGRRTGGAAGSAEDAAGYTIMAVYKNVSGTATLVSTVDVVAKENQAGWDATFNVSSGTVLCQVTGAVNNNITWNMVATINQVST